MLTAEQRDDVQGLRRDPTLRPEGIALSARQTRKYLKLLGARWRRTVRTLQHRPDPARVGRAQRVLANLKKMAHGPAAHPGG